MRLNVGVSIEMSFKCGQCGVDMEMKGPKDHNPSPMLECPQCGYKVQVVQGPQLPLLPGTTKRYPPLKPKRF